ERFFETFALVLSATVRRLRDLDERENEAKKVTRQLARAETLMREMHHRMKNYFQVIMSLLSLKSGSVKTEHSRAAFHEVMDRVTAIALAHDMLVLRDGQQGVVHAASYLAALCSSVESMSQTLRIETDLEDAELRIDRAVPLGLILNELVTNSLKHAVRNKPDGLIQVTFRAPSPKGGEAFLRVADNGPGMGEPREGTSGLILVRALSGQISGRLDIDTSVQGTTVCVHFPLVE
ncbi:MAG TPA: sensor histidine kinase, partial [Azospirillaceae bacterium]|nr:sensor histidine kinase [Azospirillaceae bacterium]